MIHDDISELTHKSAVRVTVECDFKVSSKCRKIWTNELRAINVGRNRNDGKDLCLYCSIELKRTGNNSHYFKYPKQEDFFDEIDSELKAYLLGWIASDGHVGKKRIIIKLQRRDEKILQYFIDNIMPSGVIHRKTHKNKDVSIIYLNSKKLVDSVCKHLNIQPGPKDYVLSMPTLNNDFLIWSFIRGYFEGDGHVPKTNSKEGIPRITIASVSEAIKSQFKTIWLYNNIKSSLTKKSITANGRYGNLLISKMYNNPNYFLDRKYDQCMYWLNNWKPREKSIDMETAEKIKSLRETEHLTIKDLALKFNVGKTTISRIINEKDSYKKE